MCPSSVRRPSTGYDSFDEFVDHSTTNRQPYGFVTGTSRVDYCNLLLAGAPKSVTDKLQRVMNAATRVVSGTKKYDRGLTYLLQSELPGLDVADQVTYKLWVTAYKCLYVCMYGQALDYLSDLFHGFSSIGTAVAPSLSLDRRHRTCSKTICVSCTCKLTIFVVH